MSDGRLEVGLGAGWYEAEFNAAGIPFGSAGQRIDRLSVVAGQLDARLDPRPPIIVGGKGGPKLARVVAEHADWWNYSFRDMPTYVQKQEALKAHCREVKRDYDTIEQVVRVGILIADNEREIERVKARPGTRPLGDIHVIGTPAQVTETMRGILRQGARRFTVNFADVPHPEGAWLFSSTVLPHLR